MSATYLEVTYRKGKPLAAYLYVNRRESDVVARTERFECFALDLSADDRVIGVEFLSCEGVDLVALNAAMGVHSQSPLSAAELLPLCAA